MGGSVRIISQNITQATWTLALNPADGAPLGRGLVVPATFAIRGWVSAAPQTKRSNAQVINRPDWG